MEDFWDGKEMSGKLISMKRQPAIAVNEEKAESVREIIVDRSERAGEKAKEQETKSSREKSGQTEQGRREKDRKNRKKLTERLRRRNTKKKSGRESGRKKKGISGKSGKDRKQPGRR